MRCDLQIFSGCVCPLEQLHAQSPFLFPIVFSINRIMYELAVCSDGMIEAQPRSFRQNRAASTLSDIMHTPLLTSAAVVRTRAPEYEKNIV